MNTTKIVKKISVKTFIRLLLKYKNQVKVSFHALDHLSNSQRSMFNERDLVNILLREKPVAAGLQKNGRFAAFFKRKFGYIRIIFVVDDFGIEIITFINTEKIPNLRKL
jgi:mRNA-degrading endonuclease RelE of RelBE toxin-antitoxin system